MITSAIFGDSLVTLQLGRVIWRSGLGGVIIYWHGVLRIKPPSLLYLYYPKYYMCLSSTSEPVGTHMSIQREKGAREPKGHTKGLKGI